MSTVPSPNPPQATSVGRVFRGLGLALLTTTLASCAAPGAAVVHPMEVHFAAENPGDDAKSYPHWCDGGVCSVGPRVVLDERAVDRVMLQPGETRAGILLQLDTDGVAKLKAMLQGHSGDQRLSIIIDGKAVQGWTARRTLDAKSIRVTGPRKDMLRLYNTLTRPPARRGKARKAARPARDGKQPSVAPPR